MFQANKGNSLSIDNLRRKHLRHKNFVTLLLILGTLFSAVATAWTYSQETRLAHTISGVGNLAFPRVSLGSRATVTSPDPVHRLLANRERRQAERQTVRPAPTAVAAGLSDSGSDTLLIKREWVPIVQAIALVLMVFAVLLLGIGLRWERRSNSHL